VYMYLKRKSTAEHGIEQLSSYYFVLTGNPF
jgi:hypothetical protein